MQRIAMVLCAIAFSFNSFAQQSKEQRKELKAAQNYLSEAQQSLQKKEFPSAEADYRKAISLNPKSETAKYNLGTAYYGKEKNAEAMLRFKQAAQTATDKAEKHKAFHNLGNTFMNEKKYTEAVEAYKNALRNNPNDDETRYNLALAKDMLEKNPPAPQDKDDKNKDQDKKDQDKKDQQDKQDKKDQGDEKDNKDKGDQKEDKKEGDKDKDQGKPDKPKDKEGDKPQQQQPVPGQLSPQQVKSLLEAMNNEEKKTQDKINAEKQKGEKVKSDKDW
ncbi:MAG: tetratricopeptide repeat protein [Flavobacteriaceae bacterium]|nr:tetratricopeptide repeat protein [Flavobacteriaceae bacterium]